MTRRAEKVRVQKHVTSYVTTYTCTKCGRSIDPTLDGPEFANELIILLNQEQCVSQRFRRDYCTECLTPIWLDLCQLLDIDPDDISGADFDDPLL